MYKITNSYSNLKKVIMHRPGRELLNVTEENCKYFGYSSPVDLEKSQYEYDKFIECLRKFDVEPILIGEVLKDDIEAQSYISGRPNVHFTRDLATMIGGGLVLMNLAMKGRKWDEWLIKRVAEKLNVSVTGTIGPEGILEGGGVEFLTDNILIVGFCDRTNDVAITKLVDYAFENGISEVVAVQLYEGAIHIDGVFMPIDKNLVLVVSELINQYPTVVFRKGVRPKYTWFMDVLKDKEIDFIDISLDEERLGAVNFIQVGPRQLVGYEGAYRVINEIEKRGGSVLAFPGEELFKGNGGPHCMTCPILRSHE